MMIKYCNKCAGSPYTEDFTISRCPVCGSDLSAEMADTDSLASRSKLSVFPSGGGPAGNTFTPFAPASSPFVIPQNNGTYPNRTSTVQQGNGNNSNLPANTPTNTFSVVPINVNTAEPEYEQETRTGVTSITGKVSQYTSSGKEDGAYRRLFISKIIDAVFYHQRLEDVVHRFNVRVDNGKDAMGYSRYSDIPVNVHGTIASGMQITDNAEVEVEGKYRNGVLMASRISIVNNGFTSQIKFQRSITAIVYGMLAALLAVMMVIFAANADGAFFSNLKDFFVTWLVTFIVVTVLYCMLIFTRFGFLIRLTSGQKRRFPIVGILLFSLVLTLIFMNSFGLGTTISGLLMRLLSTIIPTIIVIVAIVFLIKAVIK